MSGTNTENKGLSDNEKLNEPSMEELADAIQKGDVTGLDRLMAVEKTESEDDSTPNEPEIPEIDEKPTEEDESNEEEDEHGKKAEKEDEESDEDTEQASEPEAATPAASPAGKAQEENIEELRRELHRYKSDAGRVPYMQRRMAELERELRAVKARSPDNPNAGKPNSADINAIELDDETKAQIEALREIDPVYAKTVERAAKAAIAAASARFENSFDTYVSEEQKAEDERFYLEQKARLSEMIPQHEQIFSTPEWKQWKQMLLPAQRAMAESAYADEVAQAIYAFAADMQKLQAHQTRQMGGGQVVEQQAAPAQSSQTPNAEESEVQKARKEKLKAANVPNTAAKKEQQLDQDAYFEQMYNEIAKANHIVK